MTLLQWMWSGSHRARRALACCAIALAFSAGSTAQTALLVDDDAPGGGDGSSWTAAFNNLQHALDAAANLPGQQVTVRVAQGNYVPTNNGAFRLLDDVTLEGGYAGLGAPDPNVRDPTAYVSVLNGDTLSNDSPEFSSYYDNLSVIVTAFDLVAPSILDGFTIRGASNVSGGAIDITDCSPTITACVIRDNLGRGASITGECDPAFTNCAFILNIGTGMQGGAAVLSMSSNPTFIGCRFERNSSLGLGGALECRDFTDIEIVNCEFLHNRGVAGGGALFEAQDEPSSFLVLDNCRFRGNVGDQAGGGMIAARLSLVMNRCTFTSNDGGVVGGGVIDGSDSSTFTNCVFVRNRSIHPGGGIAFAGYAHATVTNCTFAENVNGGLHSQSSDNNVLRNSILWGNSNGQIMGAITTDFCNIQGGWDGPGSNNIDVNPLFLQPGCDNLRLAHNSPCLDAGSNALVPAGITIDLDGNPRIQNGIVDMGAYEGGHDPLPPAACASNIYAGDQVRLIPTGGAYNPVQRAVADLVNQGGPDQSSAMATQFDLPIHPAAGGFNELGDALQLETSIADGDLLTRVTIPFDQSELAGFDPITVDLTFFNAQANQWMLAAMGNVQNSPGHSGPLGDRIVVQNNSTNFGMTWDVGDYGVFWNPELQRGFAWAVVDHASEFAFGVPLPLCTGDCAFPANGTVDLADVYAVLDAWGLTPPGPASFADINRDGVVDIDDLLEVISAWGPCS